MPSQQGPTLPSFPPGVPCLCVWAPPQLFSYFMSFCQAGPKLEAVYPAPRDDCGGGSSLSEEGAVLL